jgi:hypothetical protein
MKHIKLFEAFVNEAKKPNFEPTKHLLLLKEIVEKSKRIFSDKIVIDTPSLLKKDPEFNSPTVTLKPAGRILYISNKVDSFTDADILHSTKKGDSNRMSELNTHYGWDPEIFAVIGYEDNTGLGTPKRDGTGTAPAMNIVSSRQNAIIDSCNAFLRFRFLVDEKEDDAKVEIVSMLNLQTMEFKCLFTEGTAKSAKQFKNEELDKKSTEEILKKIKSVLPSGIPIKPVAIKDANGVDLNQEEMIEKWNEFLKTPAAGKQYLPPIKSVKNNKSKADITFDVDVEKFGKTSYKEDYDLVGELHIEVSDYVISGVLDDFTYFSADEDENGRLEAKIQNFMDRVEKTFQKFLDKIK